MTRFNVGGTSQWLFNLSQGLSENEIENLLLVGECPQSETEDSRLSKIPHKIITGLGPKNSIPSTISSLFQLRKAIKDFRPDLVNTHTSKAGVLGRIAAFTLPNRPTIVHTYHGHVLSGYFNPLFEKLIQVIEISLSLITDFFLVSGQQVLSDIKKARIIRKSNVLNIWPAVADFSLGDRKKLRASLNIDNARVVVGWLGRKVPIKRIDRILDLAQARPEIYFLIAGDGDSIKKTFADRFKSSALANVIELGFTTPSDIWSIADICLISSDNEAMPISPIEASLAKLPLIGVDAGSTREVIIDGETGYICKGEVGELLKALDKLSANKTKREAMGLAARKYALDKFNPSSSISRQIQGYREALDQKSRRN
jgi:glycosyltransferase involved in cell wall biosynthesis